MTIVLILSLLISQLLSIFVPSAYAASSPWTQTDWSGGSGQTAWSDNTKYSSSSNVDTSTTPGQATITNTEQLTNAGFESNLNSWSYSADQTLTTSGNEITDVTRTTNTQGDGVTPPDSSYGIWPAATNLITNGGFETNTTGWSTGGTNTIVRSTEQAKFGSASIKGTWNGGSTALQLFSITLTAAVHSLSGWVYIPSDYDGTTVRLRFNSFTEATGTLFVDANMSLRDQWQRLTIPNVTIVSGDLVGEIRLNAETNPTAGKFVYLDGVQLETGSVATPYIETNGGTATRNAARVQAPSSVLNKDQMWVAVRMRMGFPSTQTGFLEIFQWDDGTNVLGAYLNSGALYVQDTGTASGQRITSFAVGDYKTFIIRYTATTKTSSVDGGVFGGTSQTRGGLFSGGNATFDIGRRSNSANYWISSDVLWFAAGTGTLTDADASTINGYGNTDPTINSIPSTANTTFVWTADTATYTAGSVARDTSTTYSSSAGSAKIISSQTTGNFTQSVNVGDTNTYSLSAYAYTDGSAVTTSDVQLLANGSLISTTITPTATAGWYKLTGTTPGVASSVAYGVQVKAGKTVYVDNMSLNSFPTSGTLTSSIFDTGTGTDGSNWGTLTYNATTPTNTSVSVKARTSNSSTMTGATDFSLCTAITSGVDISSNSCVTDGHRYIQYQVTLLTTDTSITPTFADISIAFSQKDATPPLSVNLDSPGDNSYTNNERPTFRWKTTTDATSGLSKYVLEIDNPSIGSTQPSGDFSIDNIPTSGTTDSVNNKYVIHFENFNDSDSTNNYISVYTKSHSDWGTSENDGKLREGKVSWKVKAVDNAGNETSASRTLFVDRTNPNVEFTQINSTPYTSNNFSTTDKTPTIFGKITDPLAGGDSSQTQTENGPRVASGPKEVNIKVEKKEGLLYKLVTLYKINMDNPYYTCESGKTIDNSKQKCDKYLPFEYTPEQNLDLGTYKITVSGKDKADNSSSETSFTLNITTYAQITTQLQSTPEESKSTPEVSKHDKEGNITIPTESPKPNLIVQTGENIVNAAGNFISAIFSGIGNGVKFVAGGIGSGLAFIFDQTGQGLASIGNWIAAAYNNTAQAIGSGLAYAGRVIGDGYSQLANNAPGFAKNILMAMGNGFGTAGNFISKASLSLVQNVGTLANNMGTGIHNMGSAIAQGFNNTVNGAKNGIANLAFAVGEKTDDVSHGLGTAIIKIGYLFVPEPTKISGVKVAKSTSNSMTITWKTNHPASGKINYGLTADYGQDLQSDKRITSHGFTVTGLKPNTTYYYEVMSQNRNYVYDANHTFTTPK